MTKVSNTSTHIRVPHHPAQSKERAFESSRALARAKESWHLHEYDAVDGDAEPQPRRSRAPGCLDGLRCRPLHRQVQPSREAAEALLDDHRGLCLPQLLSRLCHQSLHELAARYVTMSCLHRGCVMRILASQKSGLAQLVEATSAFNEIMWRASQLAGVCGVS